MKVKKIRTLNFGIIGLSYGSQHQYINELLNNPYSKIVALSEENKKVGELAAKRIKADWIPNWKDLVRRDDIDAVCIASENHNHYNQIIASLAASKHVLCENPLTLDIKKFDNITKTRKNSDTKILVPFKPRFNSSLIQVKKLISQGDIGELGGVFFSIFNSQRLKRKETRLFNNLETIVGCILDVGAHAFDYILWLVNAEPERIYSVSKNANETKEIAAVTTIKFSNGTIVTINMGYLKNDINPIVQKTNSEMNIELTGFNRTIIVDAYHQRIKTSRLNQNGIEQTYWGSLESKNIIEYYIDSIKKNIEMFPNEIDAKKVHRLIFAAYKSSQKKDWVQF